MNLQGSWIRENTLPILYASSSSNDLPALESKIITSSINFLNLLSKKQRKSIRFGKIVPRKNAGGMGITRNKHSHLSLVFPSVSRKT